jgi:hypothetical protein
MASCVRWKSLNLRLQSLPREIATCHSFLGNALATLGERESGTARLEEAIAAYRDADDCHGIGPLAGGALGVEWPKSRRVLLKI